MMTRIHILLLVVLVFGMISGCTKGRDLPVQFVEGIVTLDGEPLAGANVAFIPKDFSLSADPANRPKLGTVPEVAGGSTDAQGQYLLGSVHGKPGKGALVGDYVVTIAKSELIRPPGADPASQEEGGSAPPPSRYITPKIYIDRTTTPFTATVVKGKNKFDFDLKSKP